ncbi:MAG TPA: hypothetical protein DEA26_06295 [Oceanospirillales bacterium]|nr:hypothetical protein [Oceanospirillaceae bacterium]HBS42270.1 hypothetical protein [Oceanospirillales bacterium]|tara:strand:- start:1022 stop:1486 length:465 start_codon:yes stop_codon:yes gene_type:complete
MPSYPHFIAIDASSREESAFPVAIAWSLENGTIKTALIQPEDDWDDWDYSLEDLHGISQHTLYQLGETPWSVIRELEHDLEQPLLFSHEPDITQILLERLYDACGRELSVETADHSDGISDPQRLHDWQLDHALDHQPCDERVRLMLMLYAGQD